MSTDDRLLQVFRDVFTDHALVLQDSTGPADVDAWDSLATVSLLYALEAEFDVEIDDEDVAVLSTVGAIKAYLERHGAGASP